MQKHTVNGAVVEIDNIYLFAKWFGNVAQVDL